MTYRIDNLNPIGQRVGGLDKVKHFWAADNYAKNVAIYCRKNRACQIRDIYIINEITGATIRRTV